MLQDFSIGPFGEVHHAHSSAADDAHEPEGAAMGAHRIQISDCLARRGGEGPRQEMGGAGIERQEVFGFAECIRSRRMARNIPSALVRRKVRELMKQLINFGSHMACH